MSVEFSPLADGLMSYLASRAHDWLSWQIEENSTELKISVISNSGPSNTACLVEKIVPPASSPSQIIDQMLFELSAGKGKSTQHLPQAQFPKLRNSLGVGAVK